MCGVLGERGDKCESVMITRAAATILLLCDARRRGGQDNLNGLRHSSSLRNTVAYLCYFSRLSYLSSPRGQEATKVTYRYEM